MVYNRYHGDGQKDVLNKALTCQTSFPTRQYNVRIGGFIKQTPFSNGGGRTPENGVHTFPDFGIGQNGLSESHAGSNKWLDLWYNGNMNGRYDVSDSASAAGTKCIAGVCYLNEPVWLMYR